MPYLLLLYHLPDPFAWLYERFFNPEQHELFMNQSVKISGICGTVFWFLANKKTRIASLFQGYSCAEGGTWTLMRLLSLRPERSASANSATSAFRMAECILSQRHVLSTECTVISRGFLKPGLELLIHKFHRLDEGFHFAWLSWIRKRTVLWHNIQTIGRKGDFHFRTNVLKCYYPLNTYKS